MAIGRIRLLRIPDRHLGRLSYSGLTISVIDSKGEQFSTVTLTEALVHLRSTKGARIVIQETVKRHRKRKEDGDSEPTRDHSRLQIKREADGIRAYVHAGPNPAWDGDEFIDYSRSGDIELVGQMRQEVVDVEIVDPG